MFNLWLNQQPALNVADSACRDFLIRSPWEHQSGLTGGRFNNLPGIYPAGQTGLYRANGAGKTADYAGQSLPDGPAAR